jgi:hypothetical protein
MHADIPLGPGPPVRVAVMEGEPPEAAVERAAAGRPGVSPAARRRATAALRRRMLRQLAREQQALDDLVPPYDDHLTWARAPGMPPPPPAPDGPEHAARARGPLPAVQNRADAAEERDQAAAQAALHAMQFPPGGCGDGRRVLVARFDRAVWGLAVNVHYLTASHVADPDMRLGSGRPFLCRRDESVSP